MADASVRVVGSANLDLVFRSARLPRPGETILGREFTTHPGGKGANQAVAIGRLGGDVLFVGCVGADVFGETLRQSLADAGVRMEALSVEPDVATGTACILVDDEGMNSIVVAPGANDRLTPLRVRQAAMPEAAVVLAQLEVPLEAVETAAEAKRFVLNPAPARALPGALLARCEVLTPNELELEALTGVAATDDEACGQGGRKLLDQGVRNVVVTLGARGSYWVSPAGGRHFPAPRVEAVDTTAAGDAFNGALALFLAEGRDLPNAIALANCVGALSTTRPGAQASMPTREALRALAGPLL